jgi:hypothetical protein
MSDKTKTKAELLEIWPRRCAIRNPSRSRNPILPATRNPNET